MKIKNEKQYKITRKLLSQWEVNYHLLHSGIDADVPRWLHQERLRGTKAEIRRLSAELKEYKEVRDGKKKLPDLKIVQELPDLLVQWRIAQRLTQRELAHKLHIHENQVQRYENSDYAGASLATIQEIVRVLGQTQSRSIGH